VARCCFAAGDLERGGAVIERLAAGGLDGEDVVELVHHFAQAALRVQTPAVAAAWLERRLPSLEQAIGRSYDLMLALFKLHAAAQAPSEILLTTAHALAERDKKSFRHDLTREPLWIVREADPGELLETADAAAVIGRSPNFVAKRLEQGTMPCHRSGDRLRIPAKALSAWKAVMDAHKLLD
jgi:hypothetical protein